MASMAYTLPASDVRWSRYDVLRSLREHRCALRNRRSAIDCGAKLRFRLILRRISSNVCWLFNV